MIPHFRLLFLMMLVVSASCSSGDEPKVASVHCRGKSELAQMTFTVEAVDAARHSITLKGPEGNSATFTAGPEVKRFSEIHAGDSIVVQYVAGMQAELREPTAEEASNPVHVVDTTQRDPSSSPPAAALYRSVRVVTTVGDVNLSRQTLDLKGPRGNTMTFKVEEPAALTGTRHGRPIIATFVEQLTIAVEPAPKK